MNIWMAQGSGLKRVGTHSCRPLQLELWIQYIILHFGPQSNWRVWIAMIIKHIKLRWTGTATHKSDWVSHQNQRPHQLNQQKDLIIQFICMSNIEADYPSISCSQGDAFNQILYFNTMCILLWSGRRQTCFELRFTFVNLNFNVKTSWCEFKLWGSMRMSLVQLNASSPASCIQGGVLTVHSPWTA